MSCPLHPLHRDRDLKPRAGAGTAFDDEGATGALRALLHGLQPESSVVANTCRIEAGAVILDGGADLAVVGLEAQPGPGPGGVLLHVGQRLLDDANKLNLSRRGERQRRITLAFELAGDAGLEAESLDVLTQGAAEVTARGGGSGQVAERM